MNILFKQITVIKSAGLAATLSLLAACGGGSTPTVITQGDAQVILQNARFVSDFTTYSIAVLADNHLELTAITGTGFSVATPTSPVTVNCTVSGTLAYTYKKSVSVGLSAGDYIEETMTNCVSYANGPKNNGTFRLTTPVAISTDLSNATTKDMPFTLLLTNFRSQKQTAPSTYSSTYDTFTGTINYTTYKQINNLKDIIVANSTQLTVDSVVVGGSKHYVYSALSKSIIFDNPLKGGRDSATDSMNFAGTQTPTVGAVVTVTPMTLATTNYESTNGFSTSVPVAATYNVTNVLGGRVYGTFTYPSTIAAVQIDYGNDGSMDDSFAISTSAI